MTLMNTKALALVSIVVCSLGAMRTAHAKDDWPGVNLTLEFTRYAQQTEITAANVAALKTICSRDVGRQTAFQTGPPIVVDVIYATTEFDTIALDSLICAVNGSWRQTPTVAGCAGVPRHRHQC